MTEPQTVAPRGEKLVLFEKPLQALPCVAALCDSPEPIHTRMHRQRAHASADVRSRGVLPITNATMGQSSTGPTRGLAM